MEYYGHLKLIMKENVICKYKMMETWSSTLKTMNLFGPVTLVEMMAKIGSLCKEMETWYYIMKIVNPSGLLILNNVDLIII